MTIAIMQPYFFPYIGYWQLIHAVDVFVIFDDVNYMNKGYINRNNILVRGEKKLITLELIGASQNKKINEIKIGRNRVKLLKTIEMAYSKAPHFDEVFPTIKEILTHKENNLAMFLYFSLMKISQTLQLNTKFIFSSDIKKDNHLTAQDKIIDIVKNLNSTNYVNLIGGQKLYDKDVFSQKNIKLNFIHAEPQKYRQFNDTFVPDLSIIDILMFNNIDEIRKFLNEYELA